MTSGEDERRDPITVADLHRALTKGLTQDKGGESARDPAIGRGLYFGGLTRFGRHWLAVRRRGAPVPSELISPTGQAAAWYDVVSKDAPQSGREVAHQIARLCGDATQVTIPIRSLADAVGRTDKIGRLVAYTERGIQWLTDAGWLRKEVTGKGAGAKTTYFLMTLDQ